MSNSSRLAVVLALAAVAIAIGGTATMTMAAPTDPTTVAGHRVYWKFTPDQAKRIDNGEFLATLNVPPGMYAISGKVNLDNDSSATQHVSCRLQASTSYDRNIVRLAPSGSGDTATLPFHLVQDFSVNSPIQMNCVMQNGTANV